MSFHNEEEDETDNDTGMLLNLSQKSGIFVADQTPTPTRLIKNCEEVGLFEDLRNVNPFDETFRRACEQNVQHTPGSQQFHSDENSLHTPQVFPQFDTAVEGGIVAGEDLTKQTLDTPVVLDGESVENILDAPKPCIKPKNAEPCPTKYRAIAEKPAANTNQPTQTEVTFLPSSLQFIQPQVITVTFPNPTTETQNNTATLQQFYQTKKYLTKTKPLLLPKLSTTYITATKDTTVTTTSVCSSATSTYSSPHPEPSSASLTPTSQLPIKERLKAILNQSSKIRPTDWSDKSCSTKNFIRNKSNLHKSSKDDTMERKRAASTRYRHKMRNEYKELRKSNNELLAENDKLKERIRQLVTENTKLKSASTQPVLASSNVSALGIPAQIQIPASTIHLVMNIPKLVVPCGTSDFNTPTMLKNPFSYKIDKN